MGGILIVDDHPLFRRGVRDTILEKFKDMEVEEAENGPAALQKVREKEYRLIVLDLVLPGRHGLEILKDIRSLRPAAQVLIISFHTEAQYALAALNAGARGYVSKAETPKKFLAALKEVLSGRTYFGNDILEGLANNLHPRGDKKPHELLTVRELEVMEMIAAGKKLIEIAGELSLSINTISTYRRRVLSKMNFHNNADIVRYAVEEKLLE